MAVDDGVYLVARGASLARAAPGVLANDVGAASLAAILSRDVQNGTLSLSGDGSFSYVHDGSTTTSDSFSYRASDGVLESGEAEVLIAVTAAQGATLEVPGDYASIQEAHDAAASGDLILLAPGLYQENPILSKAVTLASWFATTGDESYIETTLLDGMGRAAAIEVPSSAEDGATIAGLTIQNADDGLAVRAKIHLVRNRIRWTSDGVDYEDGSGGTCRYNLFEENSDDGIDPDSAVDIVIEHNTIRNNGGDGIEIRLQPYTGPTLDYVIRHNRIYGNQEDGIQLIDYDRITNRRFEISHNAIYDNAEAGLGMMSGANTRENYEGASIEERIYVIGNTFRGNNHGMTGGDNAVVLNNLFVGHPVLALKNVDGNSEVAFNMFHDNAAVASNSNLDAATNFSVDPLLGADLDLVAESPAIDAGTAFYTWQGLTVLDLDVTDYSGAAPDLGAFEWVPGRVGPEAPTLVEPLEGAANVSLTPTLRWLGAGDSFELQIGTSEDFVASHRVEEATIPGPALEYAPSFGVLAHAESYFWRVRGVDASGTGSWSAVGRYSTAAASGPPGAPLLLSPVAGAASVDLMPTFEWLAVAEGFEVQLATDPWFASLVLNVDADSRSLVPPPGALSHATTYHWRVRGQNAFGPGP
ncbi:MAG: right-handed parallel beta-helix repeat-containing protein, partial [Myxococcota bacterium]